MRTQIFISKTSLLELPLNTFWSIVGGTTTKPKYTLPNNRFASTNQGISNNAMRKSCQLAISNSQPTGHYQTEHKQEREWFESGTQT